MKTFSQQVDNFINSHAELAARAWFREQCRDPNTKFYLWYRPSEGKTWGAFLVMPECPNDQFRIACQSRISPALSERQVREFICQQVRTLPILPTKE